MNRIFILTLLGACLLLQACGNKGPLQPLTGKQPAAVASASLLQRGESFQLQWQLPQSNQDGTRLTDLAQVEVERLISAPSDFCPDCPDAWPRIARINPQLPAPALQVRDLYILSDQAGPVGSNVYYRLRPRNMQGLYGPPQALQQAIREPVAAPAGLNAVADDRRVELSWNPSAAPAGATLLGYQVYRRPAGQPFSPLPTNLSPLEKTGFSDFGLDNGRRYEYRVRSLFDFSGERLESLPGEPVTAVPAAN